MSIAGCTSPAVKILQVKPSAEHPVVAGDYHRADVVAIGVVERLVEGLLHGRPQRIDLPVVHRDHRDGLVSTIGDRSAHDAPSAAAHYCFVSMLRNKATKCKRRSQPQGLARCGTRYVLKGRSSVPGLPMVHQRQWP